MIQNAYAIDEKLRQENVEKTHEKELGSTPNELPRRFLTLNFINNYEKSIINTSLVVKILFSNLVERRAVDYYIFDKLGLRLEFDIGTIFKIQDEHLKKYSSFW